MGAKSKTTLREGNPGAAEMWAYDLNNAEMTPDIVSVGSEKPAWFRCTSNPKHVFRKKICKMTSDRDGHNIGCIYCGPNAKVAFPGETDLLTACPQAGKLWDYERNKELGLDPTQLLPKSNKKAWFTCPAGHSEFKRIQFFFKSPCCQVCKSEEGLLVNIVPQTSDFWDYRKNDGDPDKLMQSHRSLFWMKCPECGYEFYTGSQSWRREPFCHACGYDGNPDHTILNRERLGDNAIVPFAVSCPEVIKYWDYELNGDETPYSVTRMSNKKLHFKCPSGHIFIRSPQDSVRPDGAFRGCKYCGDRTFAYEGETDLFTVCPDAKAMWGDNPELDPLKLHCGSTDTVEFRCPDGHIFRKRIDKFVQNPVCPACEFRETKSLAVVPDLLQYWDFEKNTLDPYTLTPSSTEKAYWKCNKCGYKWEAIIGKQYIEGSHCPSCDRKHKFIMIRPLSEVRPGYLKTDAADDETEYDTSENLFSACPVAKDWWDYSLNKKSDLKRISPQSHEYVYWICDKGHSFKKAIDSFVSNPECTECRRMANMLTEFPYLVEQWDFERNRHLDIHQMFVFFDENVWWKCKKCGYSWQAPIRNRKSTKGLCPCCDNGRVVTGINDLFTVCPTAKEQWDYDKNQGYNLDRIHSQSRDIVHWICRKGHSFRKSILSFVANQECTECRRLANVVDKYPVLVEQWDYERNRDIDIHQVSSSSDLNVWWKCKKCGYSWQALISSRKVTQGLCPCCENRTVVVEGITDLFTLVPDLLKDYDFEKNAGTYIGQLSTTSQEIVYWKCHVCGYEWSTGAGTRVKKDNGEYRIAKCPACEGIVRMKSYSEQYPNLVPMFDEDVNGIRLEDLTGKDLKTKYVWNCPRCGHCFSSTLGAMTRSYDTQFHGCSICAGKTVVRERSFGYLHPELIDEYSPNNELSAYEVAEYSNREAEWICRNNPEHTWRAVIAYRTNGSNKCPVCYPPAEHFLLVEKCPDLRKYYSSQNELEFDSLALYSNENVLWDCGNGHHFLWPVYKEAVKGEFYCPYCNYTIIEYGINSLADENPALAREWSPNNEKPATKVSRKLTNPGLWVCPDCGGEYLYSVKMREAGDQVCPYCNDRRYRKGINDFATKHPELLDEWSPNNGKLPEDVFFKERDKVLWICRECGEEYSYPVWLREEDDGSCPYCNNRELLPGLNDFGSQFPELAEEWSTRNTIGADEVLYTRNFTVYWDCPVCHGTYPAKMHDRKVNDDACPYCRNVSLLQGYNDLESVNPGLASEWSTNNDRTADQVMANWGIPALWICPECGGEYPYRINGRKVGDESCPYCNDRKVLPGLNDFATVHPELLPEWSPNNDIKPSEVLATRQNVILWICPDCGNEYNYLMTLRQLGDDACPYCNYRLILTGLNDFATMYPELSAEWSPNNNMKPSEVLATRQHRVLWICPECGGEYAWPMNERHLGDDVCPYCNNRKVLPGYNSLLVKYPELMTEWDTINNLLIGVDADQILPQNIQPIWWICNSCGYHYRMATSRRIMYETRHQIACSKCKGRRQKRRFNG